MATKRPYVKHLSTTGSQAPSADLLQDAEIAIAKSKDAPKLFIKKTDGTIAEFIDSNVVDARITQGKSDAIAAAAEDATSKANAAVATRMVIDMSNIDEDGKQKLNDVAMAGEVGQKLGDLSTKSWRDLHFD